MIGGECGTDQRGKGGCFARQKSIPQINASKIVVQVARASPTPSAVATPCRRENCGKPAACARKSQTGQPGTVRAPLIPASWQVLLAQRLSAYLSLMSAPQAAGPHRYMLVAPGQGALASGVRESEQSGGQDCPEMGATGTPRIKAKRNHGDEGTGR